MVKTAPAVQTTALTKAYGGKRALDGVDLTVDEGSIFGFLGPNGAGKTTMLRLLTGLARPSSGSVRIFGQDVTSAGNTVRAQIGFLPDVPGFYEWMTAPEFLRFTGGLFGITRAVLEPRIELLIDQAGLGGVTTTIGAYSRGMKQRLGVAQALINAPKLLLLDEPTSALDPMGRRDVLAMLTALRGRATVFFSTHILADVERVCDTVAILDAGRVVAHGAVRDLRARYGKQKVVVEVTDGGAEFADALRKMPWATSVNRSSASAVEITVTDLAAAQRDIPAMVAARHIGLSRLEAGEMGLEEVFVELVGHGSAGVASAGQKNAAAGRVRA
jgi:ABC-2 type transport system ATP-binding protein